MARVVLPDYTKERRTANGRGSSTHGRGQEHYRVVSMVAALKGRPPCSGIRQEWHHSGTNQFDIRAEFDYNYGTPAQCGEEYFVATQLPTSIARALSVPWQQTSQFSTRSLPKCGGLSCNHFTHRCSVVHNSKTKIVGLDQVLGVRSCQHGQHQR
jgi:hypothetical protein